MKRVEAAHRRKQQVEKTARDIQVHVICSLLLWAVDPVCIVSFHLILVESSFHLQVAEV